mmetsp:Transcript_11043/g.14439  ORF Transcript_11043/g.14439 Transcript_11043/m.14439 type:complete len:203 (+) Transcript_11043:484-1092(+)
MLCFWIGSKLRSLFFGLGHYVFHTHWLIGFILANDPGVDTLVHEEIPAINWNFGQNAGITSMCDWQANHGQGECQTITVCRQNSRSSAGFPKSALRGNLSFPARGPLLAGFFVGLLHLHSRMQPCPPRTLTQAPTTPPNRNPPTYRHHGTIQKNRKAKLRDEYILVMNSNANVTVLQTLRRGINTSKKKDYQKNNIQHAHTH